MADVLARRKLLASARAELLEHPDVELPGVPGHVVASWRRSVARGVDPAVVGNDFHPDLDLDSRLVRCARPVIEHLAEQAADVPVCVVLTDERARLLVRLDTAAAIGRAADGNNFAEGFSYDEGAAGTNGVGTVLESGGPVHVVGAEHFVERLHDYACAGAPVRDPVSGRIAGVLDVSCRAEHSSPILHSLVRAAAADIQDALVRDRDPGWQALLDLYTRVEARTRHAVLAVGRRTVLASAAMQALLDPDDLAALQDHARFLMLRRADVDDHPVLPSGTVVRVRGTVVAAGGDAAGLVVVVTVPRDDEVRPRVPLASPDPGAPDAGAPRSRLRRLDRAERDAIVEALRESGGNRVAAAAALGLARSTLYRKIGQYGITG